MAVNAFALTAGDRIQTSGSVNVRQSAGGTAYASGQASGALGVISGSPQNAQIGGTGTTYTWWYVNFDSGQDGWVATTGFVAVKPATPTSPTPGTTGSPGPTQASSTVTLSWGASIGATYYDLGVVDVATGSFVVNTTTTSSSYTATLTAGKTYRWNVAAADSAGLSTYTTVIYFQTPAAVTIPATPTSPSPGTTSSPGPTQASSTVTLSWGASAGATYYDLGVVDVATGSFVVNTTTTSASYTASLTAGKTYRWNVAAGNTAGLSTYTTVIYFQTPGTIPPTPTSPSPGTTSSPGPVQASSTVTLSWGASAGATYYDLGVVDVATGSFVVNTTTTSASYVATLTAGKTYRWNVAAGNAAGLSPYTTVIYFQTPTSLLPAPTLTGPSDGATGVSTTPTFSWSTVSGANRYWLICSTSLSDLPTDPNATSCPNCVSFGLSGNTDQTSYTPPTTFPYLGTTRTLNAGTLYYWKVQGWNTSGPQQGNYSSVRTFTTSASPAPSISSVTPNPITADPANGYQTLTINGANFVNKPTLILTWTGQSGYTLPASQVTFVSSSQLTMSIRLGAAADNWTVRTVNPDSQTSSAVGFQVLAPTTAPSISSVSPNPITADAANGYQTLTVNGANFVNKPALVLTWTGQVGYPLPASRVTYVSSSQLTMSIHLGAAADNWTVRAVNSDSQTSSAVGFQVLAPTGVPPSISSVTPNPVTGSASQQTITINGANFVNKPTLTLTWTGQPGYTVPASKVTFVSSTQVQMAITTTTAPDNWTVKVTNPNGQSSGQFSFTVTGTSGQPNLVPQNVTVSSYSVQAGNQVTINWTIANTGGANCAASVTGLRLGQSPTTHPTSDPALNNSFPTPAINAGLSVQQSTTVTIPANTAAGTYYAWVIADNVANSTLHQASTTDDYAHSPAITVGSGPSMLGEPESLNVRWDSAYSGNSGPRPVNQVIDTIVIHTSEGRGNNPNLTYQGSYLAAISHFKDPASGVSAHYCISPSGEITQMVALSDRAQHATYYNSRSIGIEMAGFADDRGTWQQPNSANLVALEKLVAYLVAKYNIQVIHPAGDATTYPDYWFTETGIVAHSQIQPPPVYPRTVAGLFYADKYDPGIYFLWPSFIADVQALVDVPKFTIAGNVGLQMLTSGQCQIQIATPSQQPVTVQASDDCLNWSDVGTANLLDGKSIFSDTDAGSHTKRFYRPKP